MIILVIDPLDVEIAPVVVSDEICIVLAVIFPLASRLTNVFAVPNVAICAVFHLAISMVLSLKIAVIFPVACVDE